MQVSDLTIEGVKLLQPKVFADERGFFAELFRANRYEALLGVRFCQDNLSQSVRGTLRGLHFQVKHPQGKLVTVLSGTILDVAVDMREGSSTLGQHVMVELSADTMQQLYIPAGFAHGFLTLSDKALVHYRCTDYYHPESEATMAYDDPDLGIAWPKVSGLILSEKDRRGAAFKDCLARLR